MEWLKGQLSVSTRGKGLHPITGEINDSIQGWGIQSGICHLFIQHTSASLVISESYDPSARKDLESFLDHLVPEDQPWHQHTLEGSDDSPSHMRAMLTDTSLSVPVEDGQLHLGTWQGVYLFEHRRSGHQRKILIRCLKAE